jgi:DNA-binding transcriptional regulator PaaX
VAGSEWALDALGFREVRPGLSARPDNLALSLSELRSLAEGIGLDPGVLLIAGRTEDEAATRRWQKRWHPHRLDDEYEAALARLEESARRLPKLPADEARLECFSLGGEMIHRLAKDPLLPAEMVDVAARERVWRAMLDYDVQGKEIWASGKGEALRRMPRPQLDQAL